MKHTVNINLFVGLKSVKLSTGHEYVKNLTENSTNNVKCQQKNELSFTILNLCGDGHTHKEILKTLEMNVMKLTMHNSHPSLNKTALNIYIYIYKLWIFQSILQMTKRIGHIS